MSIEHEEGGYRYLPGVLPFASQGTAALPGHALERAVLSRVVPLADGFAAVEKHLAAVGRPLVALAGLELRMPVALPVEGFRAFNRAYIEQMDRWALLRDGVPPLTRTNVCPVTEPVAEPGVLAFSYTVATDTPTPTYVVSGVAEVPAGQPYPEGIVRAGETSPDAVSDKLTAVISEVKGIIEALGATWTSATQVHLYSELDAAGALVEGRVIDLVGAVPDAVVWHRTSPPITGVVLEVDARAYVAERYVEVPA